MAGIPDMWVGVDVGATYDDQLFFLGLIISRDINWSDFVIFTLRGAPIETKGYATSSTNFVGIYTNSPIMASNNMSNEGWEITYKQKTVMYVRFKNI